MPVIRDIVFSPTMLYEKRDEQSLANGGGGGKQN